MRLDLSSFFPSFCKTFFLQIFVGTSETFRFESKFELTRHFFSLSIIIRGNKIGSDYDEIRLISLFFRIQFFSPIIFVYTLIV